MKPLRAESDPWLQNRVLWMKDNQPDLLRTLALKPEELFQAVDAEVQAARRLQYRSQKSGATPELAQELALAQLCPQEVNPPESQLPVTEPEWQKILETLKSGEEKTRSRPTTSASSLPTGSSLKPAPSV